MSKWKAMAMWLAANLADEMTHPPGRENGCEQELAEDGSTCRRCWLLAAEAATRWPNADTSRREETGDHDHS